ncbi:MAG: ribosome assembly RNA-binding protein YhbY [Clostridia bacterium]
MINSRQRSHLRSLAHGLEPIFQVGKGGINENLIKQFEDAFEARELVKASVLSNSLYGAREACDEIAGKTGADIVQVIGSRFVLYRPSRKHKKIQLP